MNGDEGVSDVVHDVVGIGFGPANLALAIALRECIDDSGWAPRSVFFEQNGSFSWHQDMLLDDATMQVSFLKDLVTIRDPTSEFSFLNYLKERNRLVDFINQKTFFPLRLEYHDYLQWAAARLNPRVHYGARVTHLSAVRDGDRIVAIDVMAGARDGALRRLARTRDVVIGTGLRPTPPVGVTLSDRVIHSSRFLSGLAGADLPAEPHIAVVGAGQSAAEIIQYLHRHLDDAVVHSVFTRYGYSPADDTPFANRVFDPAAVDDFYNAPQEVREHLTEYHANTNYSVVDEEIIQDLYRSHYAEQVSGHQRLLIHNQSRVASFKELGDSVVASIEHMGTGEVLQQTLHLLIYATGYSPLDPESFLGELSDIVERDDHGRLQVDRDYRVRGPEHLECGVYVQGGTEHSHGLASSLLSNLATRASDIVVSINDRRQSTSGWSPSVPTAR